jgi:hypothetical protein
MQGEETLIPHPSVVRDRLAENIREGRMLRSLLRLSVRAIETRSQPASGPDRGTAQQTRREAPAR